MADFARGERLRELRESRHLSQEDAAHEIGVSVKTLRAWEKGSGIRWLNAQAVARFYEVDPENLVTRELSGEPIAPDPEVEQLERIEDRQAELLANVAGLDAKLDEVLELLRPQQRPKRRGASGA